MSLNFTNDSNSNRSSWLQQYYFQNLLHAGCWWTMGWVCQLGLASGSTRRLWWVHLGEDRRNDWGGVWHNLVREGLAPSSVDLLSSLYRSPQHVKGFRIIYIKRHVHTMFKYQHVCRISTPFASRLTSVPSLQFFQVSFAYLWTSIASICRSWISQWQWARLGMIKSNYAIQ